MDQEQSEHGPLPPPPRASSQNKSKEILRLWRSEEGDFEIMIRAGIFTDPYDWGVTLVNVARNIALFAVKHGLENNDGLVTREHILDRLREGFDEEWDDPTSEPEEWKPDA